MAIELTPHELRVLGVIIEKSMTHPAYYPMTLNAITAAANQKGNRDPVMSLSEGEAGTALHGLRQWQLVSQAPPDRRSRANRFQHEVERRFGWESPERAVMAELMLRGPQTIGELRGRASRMARVDALEYAREIVDGLQRSDPPMIVELAREPGRSVMRFAHLLGGAIPSTAATAATPAAPATPQISTTPAPESGGDLESRVADLEQTVASLRQDVDRLRAQADRDTPRDP